MIGFMPARAAPAAVSVRWALSRPRGCLRRRLAAEAADLGVQVEWQDRTAVLRVAPRVAGDPPHDLEFVAVRVATVERLRDDVIACAAERAGGAQGVRGRRKILDRRDLPG